MAKLRVAVAPTFKSTVLIPVSGGEPESIACVFKYRTRTEFMEFKATREGKDDVSSVLEFLVGWDYEEPLDAENLAFLFEKRIQAPEALYKAYLVEMQGARLGN